MYVFNSKFFGIFGKWTKIFSSFKSRCITYLSLIAIRPSKICFNIILASVSLKYPPTVFLKLFKSPPLQNSKTILYLVLVFYQSIILITFWELIISINFISFITRFKRFSVSSFCLKISFTAKNSDYSFLDDMLVARKTYP